MLFFFFFIHYSVLQNKNNGLVMVTFDGNSLKNDEDSATVATLKNVIGMFWYLEVKSSNKVLIGCTECPQGVVDLPT